MPCLKCGADLQQDSVYCPECSEPVLVAAITQSSGATQSKSIQSLRQKSKSQPAPIRQNASDSSASQKEDNGGCVFFFVFLIISLLTSLPSAFSKPGPSWSTFFISLALMWIGTFFSFHTTKLQKDNKIAFSLTLSFIAAFALSTILFFCLLIVYSSLMGFREIGKALSP
jgi:hypothetical protein